MNYPFLIAVLIVLLVAMHYVAVSLIKYFPNLKYTYLCLTLVIISIAAFFANEFLYTSSNSISRILVTIAGFWIISMLYATMILLVMDFICLFIKPKILLKGIVSAALLILVLTFGIFNAYNLKVKEVDIEIKGLNKPIKSVLVTDIHLGNYRGKEYLENLIKEINEINPDVVFNTGDLFDAKNHFYPQTDILQPFNELRMPHYFVDGNHDIYVGDATVFDLVKGTKATVLQNEIAEFGELQIVGLNNMQKDSLSHDPHTEKSNVTIQSVLEKLRPDNKKPTIILHHRPEGMEYMEKYEADLLLSGHTHGGQFFPFNLLVKFAFPFYKGLYSSNSMQVYVSEGQGTYFFPFRIGTSSELTIINLIPSKN